MSRALAVVLAIVPAAAHAGSYGNPKLSLPGKRYGFDVSDSWAAVGDANWKKMVEKGRIAGQPIDFGFFLASKGQTVNAKFKDNWKAAEKTTLLRGAYHVFDYTGTISPRKQAETYLKAVTGNASGGSFGPGSLPPVIDIESYVKPPSFACENQARIVAEVLDWIRIVKTATQSSTVIVYSGNGFWKYLGDTKALAAYPLWVADYNVAKAPLMPGAGKGAPCFPKNKSAAEVAKSNASKAPWSKWTFWQYYGETKATSVKVEGMSQGAKDFVVFNGSLEELKKLAK